ncbi:unnamed protein product, partial [Prorocentrum cordatum]
RGRLGRRAGLGARRARRPSPGDAGPPRRHLRRRPLDGLHGHQRRGAFQPAGRAEPQPGSIRLPGLAAPLWASPPRWAGGAAGAEAGEAGERLERFEGVLAAAFREQARELASLKDPRGHAQLAQAHAAAEESRLSAGSELLARVGACEAAASKAAEDLRRASEAAAAESAASAAGLERLEGRLAACERQAEDAHGAGLVLAAEAAALGRRAGALEGLVGRGPASEARARATLLERVEGVERRMGAFAEGYGAEFATTSLKLDKMQIHLAGCEAHLGTLSSTHEAQAQEVADLRSKLAGCEEGQISSALARLADDSSRLRAEFAGVVVRAEELQKEEEARLRADLDSMARQLDAVQKHLQGVEVRGQRAEPFAAVMCELGHIRTALSARENELSISEVHRAQRALAARLEAAEAGLEALRQSELRRAPEGAARDADRAQSRLRERVEALQGRLDTLAEAQGQSVTALEGLQSWCAGELEGLRKPRDHHHTALVERLNYLEEFLGYSAGMHAEQLASAHAKLGQISGRLSACEADHPPPEARSAAPQDAPSMGASLRQRIDLLEDVVSTLTQGWPGPDLPRSRPEPPRSASATTRRSPSLDGGVDSAQTAARYAWAEPTHGRLEQTRRLASARHRSVPSSRGRGDPARPLGGGDSLGVAWDPSAAAPSALAAPRPRGDSVATPEKVARSAAHRGSVHERLKFFEGLSSTPQRTPCTLDRVSVSYRPSSMPRSWLGRAPR